MARSDMLLLVFAHPYPDRSRANDVLLRSVADLDGLEVRSLYERYPDFAIDVEDEQAALLRARVVIWQHPLYWYSVPSLLKHWFDKVLARGWAYGEGGTRLHGKRCLWVVTTGAGDDAYRPDGMHAYPFAAFVPQIEQTARFCGMRWEPPLVVHAAHKIEPAELESAGRTYRERLETLLGEVREADHG